MLKGSFTALVTPFLPNGEIDFSSYVNLIHKQLEEGSHGVVIGGSTGEGVSLLLEELERLIQIAKEHSKERLYIIASTGSADTKTTIQKTAMAKKAKADAALVIFPYYNKPTFAGCLAHFSAVSQEGLPLIIYHHPGRTGLCFSPKELSEICSIRGVIGIKEAHNDLSHCEELIARTPVSFLAGNDEMTVDLMEKGAKGSISILGNFFPRIWGDLIRSALEGNFLKARALYEKVDPLCRAMNLEVNPQCIKYGMSLAGLCSSTLRLPLLEPKAEVKKAIEKAYLNLDI